MQMDSTTTFLDKYNQSVPRYTSYPSVPFWNQERFDVAEWKFRLNKTFINQSGEVSLYIHLPFCEDLCTYCACNKRITKNHAVEGPYIEAVIKEWSFYRHLLTGPVVIKEIHLGGGTPTFFSPDHLRQLINGITEGCTVSEEHEFSVEVHPNYTTDLHLETLRALGFNRISIGVQDFDPVVQGLINRIQTFQQTAHVFQKAREMGFKGVNIDLVYGLPGQTEEGISRTLKKVEVLRPDRIAFYSYAHVPWKSKVQRRYNDEDVPQGLRKWHMYRRGRQELLEMGYQAVGMDHFARKEDKLMCAFRRGELHRNFMGYTTSSNLLMIGLGASAITDTWSAFSQNERVVEIYQDKVRNGEFPIAAGHLLSRRDMVIRRFILSLMCNDQSNIPFSELREAHIDYILDKIPLLEEDGLIQVVGDKIQLLPLGRMFVRNVVAIFDEYLLDRDMNVPIFSRAI